MADLDGGAVRPTPAGPWLPVWLIRLAAVGWRVLVVLALALVVCWIASTIGVVTSSIAVALLVSAAVAPVVIRLRARGRSRTAAAGLGTLLAVAVVGGVLLVFGWVIVEYGPTLIQNLRDGASALQGRLDGAGIPPELGQTIDRVVTQAQTWLIDAISGIVSDAGRLFTVLLFGTFTTFFMLQDGDHGWAWAMQALDPRRREAITAGGQAALASVGGYLRAAAALAAVEAAVDLVLMGLFSVPLAVPLATLVFVGGFIPYLGGFVATTAVLLVALAANGPESTLLLAVLIGVSLVIEGRWLTPMAAGKTVRIHPAVILIALPVGAYVAGLFGMIIAVPLAAVALATTGSIIKALQDEAPEPGDQGLIVPDWLDLLAQWSWRFLIGIAVIAVGVAAIVQVPIVLMPVILATVLAATLAPLMQRLRARGWDPSLAAGVVTVGGFGAITAILAVTVAALLSNVDDIRNQASAGGSSIASGIQTVADALGSLADALGAGIVRIAASALIEGIALALVVIFAAALTFFFLRDAEVAWAFVTRPVTGWRKSEIDGAAGRAVGVLGGYMIGTGAISAFGAATQLVIMVILGIPLALPLAVLSFFGGFIPYIGSLVTTGLAFLVTVAVGTTQDIAIMAVYTIVFNIVQGNIVAPLVYSRAVSIHPAIVLLAIPAGSAIAGIIGMFLVVPFLGVFAATWRTILAVMGDQPPAPEPIPSTASTDDALAGVTEPTGP
jgi:predicted PurR-regulated permease PerM